MERIIFKLNGKETAIQSIQPNEDIWGTIEEMLYILWELSPAERDWKPKAVRENFALFEYCGLIHDVFALRDGRNLLVFAVEE